MANYTLSQKNSIKTIINAYFKKLGVEPPEEEIIDKVAERILKSVAVTPAEYILQSLDRTESTTVYIKLFEMLIDRGLESLLNLPSYEQIKQQGDNVARAFEEFKNDIISKIGEPLSFHITLSKNFQNLTREINAWYYLYNRRNS
jgi:hypothetical protein